MVVQRSDDPRDWAPLFEKTVWQAAYRQLGIVALPCDIKVAAQAIDTLTKEKGLGNWKWLLEGRILVWENVNVDSAFKAHFYVFGGKSRKKNSVIARQGFYRMYFFELGARMVDVSVIGRILARL